MHAFACVRFCLCFSVQIDAYNRFSLHARVSNLLASQQAFFAWASFFPHEDILQSEHAKGSVWQISAWAFTRLQKIVQCERSLSFRTPGIFKEREAAKKI